jgi:hypothetical protein
LRAQFEMLLNVRDKLSAVHTALNQLRAVRRRSKDWIARAGDKPELARVVEAAQAVVDRLKPIEAELLQVEAKSRADQLNVPVKLNGKLAALAGTIGNGDGAPTRSQSQVFDEVAGRVDFQIGLLEETVATEVEALNRSDRHGWIASGVERDLIGQRHGAAAGRIFRSAPGRGRGRRYLAASYACAGRVGEVRRADGCRRFWSGRRPERHSRAKRQLDAAARVSTCAGSTNSPSG